MMITKSNVLSSASSALSGRPEETHYGSLAEIAADAAAQKAASTEIKVSDTEILVAPDAQRLYLGDTEVGMSAYAAEQIARLARVPYSLLGRVKPETAASVLNQTFPRDGTARTGLVEQGPLGDATLRALTSARYARVWDADLLGLVEKFLPGTGWEPATPTVNRDWAKRNSDGSLKPCLFRDDRSSYTFFYGPRIDGTDDLGGLRPGWMLWNSEVGNAPLGFARVMFREFCANFTIWDGKVEQFRKARHIEGPVIREAVNEIREFVVGLADRLVWDRDMDRVLAATKAPFVTADDDEQRLAAAMERLTAKRIGLTQGEAEAAIEAQFLPENEGCEPWTVWAVSNGISSAAKALSHADGRARLQRAAGVVLAAR